MLGLREGWVARKEIVGDLPGTGEHPGVPDDVREYEVGDAGLAHPGEIARSPDLQVFLRDPEPVVRPFHHRETRDRFFALRPFHEEETD